MSTARLPTISELADWLASHQREASWAAVGLAIAIGFGDWMVGANVSLGALYVFAILMASLTMSSAGLLAFAVACALLRESFGPFRWQPAYEWRVALVSGAFTSLGLLISELDRNRKLAIENLRQREQYLLAQQAAERQLSTLVNTSPLPILIADNSGSVIFTNDAGNNLFEVSSDDPPPNIFDYLPALRTLFEEDVRAADSMRREIECSGKKRSGDPFFAHVWLTRFVATGHPRIAIVLWDASEDLCGRELSYVKSIMMTSRVLVAGFAHEVRNMVGALGALCARLAERGGLQTDAEYLAINSTLASLTNLSGSALQLGSEASESAADLSSTLKQIRVVLQPVLDAAGVQVIWSVPELPRVRGDHTALLQVFLNLAKNSERATRLIPDRKFCVDAATTDAGVTISVRDNGPGVSNPEQLFQPFRSTTGGAGIGLYISRATLRACGGDLWYEPQEKGACFQIQLLEA